MMDSHASTAQSPSFSRMWSPPKWVLDVPTHNHCKLFKSSDISKERLYLYQSFPPHIKTASRHPSGSQKTSSQWEFHASLFSLLWLLCGQLNEKVFLATNRKCYLTDWAFGNNGLTWYLARVVPVQRCACGHAAGKASDARVLKVRDAEDVVRYHSHGVRRGDEKTLLTQDHVAVLERITSRALKSYSGVHLNTIGVELSVHEHTPSPSKAAPKSYCPSLMLSTRSVAYIRLGSGGWPPKSSSGTQLMAELAGQPSSSHSNLFTYGPSTGEQTELEQGTGDRCKRVRIQWSYISYCTKKINPPAAWSTSKTKALPLLHVA